MATKDDIRDMVVKGDIRDMATKTDLAEAVKQFYRHFAFWQLGAIGIIITVVKFL